MVLVMTMESAVGGSSRISGLFGRDERTYLKNRIIRLASAFSLKDLQRYFKISVEEGGALADRNSVLAKIFSLHEVLVNEILREVRKRTMFDSSRAIEEGRLQIKGAVDWHRTSIIHLQTLETRHPIKFFYYRPEKRFETPENILLTLTFMELENDARNLLTKTELEEDLLELEKGLLKQMIYRCSRELGSFPLRQAKDKAARFLLGSEDTSSLEAEVEKRLEKSKRHNKPYRRLLEWRVKYRELDKVLGEKRKNFNFVEAENALDKLYEIWILLELIQHLKRKGVKTEFAIRGKINFLKMELEEREIETYYQRSYPLKDGWAGVAGIPDYIFLDRTTKKTVLVDAKNYEEVRATAIYKMLGFLHNFEVNDGILIFPSLDELEFDVIKGKSYGKDHSLVKVLLCPSTEREEKNEKNLDLMVQHILNVTLA